MKDLLREKHQGCGRTAAAPLLGMLLLCSLGGSANAQDASKEGACSPSDLPLRPVGADGEPPGFVKLEPLPPDAPKPPSDPRNFEGTWFHADTVELIIAKTMHGQPVPLTAEGRKIREHRLAADKAGKSIAHAASLCLPPGQSWQLNFRPFTVIDDQREIYLVFEEFHGVWKIRMNQPHRRDGAREYMGDSVGHWEGDTLVVDTVGYKAPWRVDPVGLPATKDMHAIHRIRRIDEASGPALEIVATYDDPAMFERKWSTLQTYLWRPDKAIFEEYNCEEQLGAPDGLSRYGIMQEE